MHEEVSLSKHEYEREAAEQYRKWRAANPETAAGMRAAEQISRPLRSTGRSSGACLLCKRFDYLAYHICPECRVAMAEMRPRQ